jgi:hypothetical protein
MGEAISRCVSTRAWDRADDGALIAVMRRELAVGLTWQPADGERLV